MDLQYNQIAPQFLEILPKGAFLTVKAGEKSNTMTIGWGCIGFIWQRPIIMVAVRHSRHTHAMIEQSADFTVSAPINQDFVAALALTGSKSGRDMDKFAAAKITTAPAKTVNSPVIDNCGLTVEGKILFKQDMNPENLDQSIKDNFYGDSDYHTLYFGEITACYNNVK